MSPGDISVLRPQILERRQRLQAAAAAGGDAAYLRELLEEVDAALHRLDHGGFGLCEACHEPIETERLLANPLARFCLDHLSDQEKNSLEGDLEMATRIQARLLPARDLRFSGWDTHYHYQPAGAVSGDYCELMAQDAQGAWFFALGDVAGKGVAASLLMTHLSAILRSLLTFSLSVPEVMSRANRLFCESTLASHYATLVCGRVTSDAVAELGNAGHCPPLAVAAHGVRRVEGAGLPLGLFCQAEYAARRVELPHGESLVLYSDGLTEATNPAGEEFGEQRLIHALHEHSTLAAQPLAAAVLQDLAAFRRDTPLADDLTLLVLRRCRPE
jgi:sigma-B regulation protein RsbU (phosphoserine phosphatase)